MIQPNNRRPAVIYKERLGDDLQDMSRKSVQYRKVWIVCYHVSTKRDAVLLYAYDIFGRLLKKLVIIHSCHCEGESGDSDAGVRARNTVYPLVPFGFCVL